ncbi:ATP-binding cassette domain-containing protein [Cellulomonas sp. Y8]|uniref:ATP-binding cassette domain-containing protein n=1 Tax=Cellulomonas sp. Y8 TaxID=2591145 RepID=UPI003D703A92
MPVTARSLGHRFPGGPWLFLGVDLDLRPGRSYAVTGPSGCGKSTLLAILAGWVKPARGTVEVDVPGRVSWVFQHPHGAPRRTARDHVSWPLLASGLRPADADARAQQLLDQVGLGAHADRPFAVLSGGEAQRLMLARGIAARPGLFLVDEPTAQLDRSRAHEVNIALSLLTEPATVTVVATHDEQTRQSCTDHIDLTAYGAVP